MLPIELKPEDLSVLTQADLDAFAARSKWLDEARPDQIPPAGDWDTFLALAGRFWGKSRTLTEAVWWDCFRVPGITAHALAPTIGDVRRVVFEGESGFLNKIPPSLVKSYNRSIHELIMENGSKILGFGVVEEADRLRGPQCHIMSFDELAAADRPAGNLETAYKVAALGCRLPYPDGTPSRKYLATTPRNIPFLKNLMARPGTVVVRGTSHQNLKNVASSIRYELESIEGTRFARQEIYGEILDSNDDAIFQRSWFRLWPKGKKFPEFSFVLLSLDTAMSEHNYDAKKQETDYTACVALGVFNVPQNFTELERKKLGVKTKYAALLCDFWMDHFGFPELLERTREAYRTKYGPKDRSRRPDVVMIEAKQSGISLRQTLMQYGVPTYAFNPRRQGKTMRAHAVSPLVLQGMLFVPESDRDDRRGQVRDWCEPLMDQMCSFAGEGSIKFDDGLDSLVQGLLYLSDKSFFHAEPQKNVFPDPDEKEEREQREAVIKHSREERGRYNPYGV